MKWWNRQVDRVGSNTMLNTLQVILEEMIFLAKPWAGAKTWSSQSITWMVQKPIFPTKIISFILCSEQDLNDSV